MGRNKVLVFSINVQSSYELFSDIYFMTITKNYTNLTKPE
jgi:hypothetical protein